MPVANVDAAYGGSQAIGALPVCGRMVLWPFHSFQLVTTVWPKYESIKQSLEGHASRRGCTVGRIRETCSRAKPHIFRDSVASSAMLWRWQRWRSWRPSHGPSTCISAAGTNRPVLPIYLHVTQTSSRSDLRLQTRPVYLSLPLLSCQ